MHTLVAPFMPGGSLNANRWCQSGLFFRPLRAGILNHFIIEQVVSRLPFTAAFSRRGFDFRALSGTSERIFSAVRNEITFSGTGTRVNGRQHILTISSQI